MNHPPPPQAPRNVADSPSGYGYAGGDPGYDESMALMSREEYLLSQQLKGISIGVGPIASSGRTAGPLTRRGDRSSRY